MKDNKLQHGFCHPDILFFVIERKELFSMIKQDKLSSMLGYSVMVACGLEGKNDTNLNIIIV